MSLEQFDDEMETTVTAADPKDGEYQFEVVSLAYRDNETAGGLFELKTRIVGETPYHGYENKRAYFLTKKAEGGGREPNEDARKQLVGVLKSLGFDVDNWTRANGRPWSREFEKAAAAAPGLQFKGTLKRNGQYTNVFVKARDAAADGRPERLGAAELDAAAAANKDPWD